MSEERQKILEMVQSGKVSPEEAARLIELVAAPDEAAADEPPADEAQSAEPVISSTAPLHHAESAWLYPLLGGAFLLLIGGLVVTNGYQHGRVNAWTWLCGWVPLALGLLVVTLADWARTAPWIHLRVHSTHERVSLHLPLPLGLTSLVLEVARPFVPKLRETAVDEAILTLRDELRDGHPITLNVQDDVDGERVDIEIA